MDEIDHRYGTAQGDNAPYALKVSKNYAIDAACERGTGSLANAQTNLRLSNARFVVNQTKLELWRRSTSKKMKKSLYTTVDHTFLTRDLKTLVIPENSNTFLLLFIHVKKW